MSIPTQDTLRKKTARIKHEEESDTKIVTKIIVEIEESKGNNHKKGLITAKVRRNLIPTANQTNLT